MSQRDVLRALMKTIHEHCLRRIAKDFTGNLTFKITWNQGSVYPRIKVSEEQTEDVG